MTEDDSRERMRAAAEPSPSETALELALEISNTFRSHFNLEKVMRQWPVGLFKESVSELLFYTNVMRDAIGDSAIFEFEARVAKENCTISPEDILRCSNICAVLLAPKFHPLISEPRIFEELNEAAMKRFGSDRSICFKTTTFRRPLDEYGDFKFNNGRSND
jgi:hypothetical protein